MWAGEQELIVDEIEEFLTGVRPQAVPDRVLATVLFTDIVASTERAAEVGDRRWRALLDAHNTTVRGHIERPGVASSTRRATASWPPSTGRPGRSCAPATSPAMCIGWASRCGWASTPARSSWSATTSPGSRSISPPGSWPWPDPGEVLVSSTVKDLVVGSDLRFEDRGAQTLKGVPGEWRLFAATTG